MKKFIEENKKILIIAGIIFFLIFVITNRGRLSHNREIKKIKKIETVQNVMDFKVTSKSVMLWDGKILYICNKDGDLLKRITSKEENLQMFFVENYAFIYDEDLSKIYQYSEEGEHINTIKTVGNVFNIKQQGKNITFHIKNEGTEYLSELDAKGKLNEIYKTDNYILTFDIKEVGKNFAVSEIKTSATGYQNIFTSVINGKKITNEYSSEVGLFVHSDKKKSIMVTDKNIYLVKNNETIYKEIPNISDVLVDGNKIYLIHSGVISRYNKNLEETKKYILASTGDKLTKISSSLYVYGKNDIGGEIGSRNEFNTRLGVSLEKVDINGLTVGTLKEGEVSIFNIVNSSKTNKNTVVDVSKEQEENA